jgi:hypothetical protein
MISYYSNTHTGNACGLAQVVEFLPSRCEALNSNSNTTKKCLRINQFKERKGLFSIHDQLTPLP